MSVIKMPISPDAQEAKQRKDEELMALRQKMEEERRLIEQEKQKLLKEQLQKEEQLRLEQQQKRAQEQARLQEQQRKAEELRKAEEKQRLEEEMRRKREEELRQIRLNEERLRREEEARKREEARRLKLIEEERERQQQIEINRAVKNLMSDLLGSVEEHVQTTTLQAIRNKIQNRLILGMFRRWRFNVAKNKRKRKAVDCSPVWISTKTTKQEAKELRTESQDLTLNLMKRYKYGAALDIDVLADQKIEKINILQLISASLIKRNYELQNTVPKNIFWKVTVSLPGPEELKNGRIRIEETLDGYLQWQNRGGVKVMVEQGKMHSKNLCCCLERQQGLKINELDMNGVILVAQEFTPLAYERLRTILQNIGELVKIPVVVLTQKYDDSSKEILGKLKASDIISDYAILIDNFAPDNLTGLLDEALIFLANKLEKPPPLQLDTLSSFIINNLCTEVWKRANSFAKWNSNYKTCLKNPNLVIQLYNEGLRYLERIVINETNLAYSNFPKVFREYMDCKPDYLPCDYKYFPDFWKDKKYAKMLCQTFKCLKLPKYDAKWPPTSELELEKDITKYCDCVFKNSRTIFYKVMGVILRNIDPNVNFSDIQQVLWSDVIELLSVELLMEQDLLLGEFASRSVFKELIVVYMPQSLNEYNSSDWFYLNNPVIDREIKKQLKQEVKNEAKSLDTSINLTTSDEINRTLEEVTSRLNRPRNVSQIKQDLQEFNRLMDDLETGIKIHKKISEKFETTLKNVLND